MNRPLIVSFALGMLMVSSSIITRIITPVAIFTDHQVNFSLEAIIPKEFDGWRIDSTLASPIVNPEVGDELEKIYSQTLSRTYVNKSGERIMLSIAYGAAQKTDLHAHRPEICYTASGFEIGNMTKSIVQTSVGQIPVMKLVATQGSRIEPITYWIRVGDTLTRGWIEQKITAIGYGLTGKVPDGLLFRVSTISNREEDSYRIQQAFLSSLLQAVRSEDRFWLIGQIKQ